MCAGCVVLIRANSAGDVVEPLLAGDKVATITEQQVHTKNQLLLEKADRFGDTATNRF